MEVFGLSVFDLVVLGVVSVAALVGLVTGFVRGGLFAASWVLAIGITFKLYPTTLALSEDYFDKDWAAMAAAGAGPFIVSLIILHIITQIIAARVAGSMLNMLDRSLGLIAGMAVALAILGMIYLPLSANFPEADQPDWIKNARTRPIIVQVSQMLLDLIPDAYHDIIPGIGDLARASDSSRATLDRLAAPPPLAPGESGSSDETGYSDATRDDLNREITDQQ